MGLEILVKCHVCNDLHLLQIVATDKLVYNRAVNAVRRKFPFLNVTNEVIMVRIGSPDTASTNAFNVMIAGGVFAGLCILCMACCSLFGCVIQTITSGCKRINNED